MSVSLLQPKRWNSNIKVEDIVNMTLPDFNCFIPELPILLPISACFASVGRTRHIAEVSELQAMHLRDREIMSIIL
jgi:hypothetical protein